MPDLYQRKCNLYQFTIDIIVAYINVAIIAMLMKYIGNIEMSNECLLGSVIVLMIYRVYAYIFDHIPVYGTYRVKRDDEDE